MKSPRFIADSQALTQRFVRDEAGVTMMMFGLAIIPIMLSLQIGLEYQRMSRTQSALASAADAAALTAAQVGMQLKAAGDSNWKSKGEDAGKSAFKSAVATIRDISGTPTLTVTNDNPSANNVHSVVSYTAQMNTLMTIGGLSDGNLSKTVEATTVATVTAGQQPASLPYVNVDLVMDVSPSMAIGANTADMTNMMTATANQPEGSCVFACHDVDPGSSGSDNYTVVRNWATAHSTPITLRIDVMKAAAQDLATYVQSQQNVTAQVTMGLYTMSYTLKNALNTANNGTPITLTSVTASNTSNFSTYNTAVGNVDFDKLSTYINNLKNVSSISFSLSNAPQSGMVYYPGLTNAIGGLGWPISNLFKNAINEGVSVYRIGVSDFATSLAQLTNVEGTSGDGTSSATPKKVVILITDGLFDIETGYGGNNLASPTYSYPSTVSFNPTSGDPLGKNTWAKFTAPLSSSLCTALKNNGVQVGVIYVTYVPNPGEVNYNAVVAQNAPQASLQSNLQACASSPSMYYNASSLTDLRSDITTGLTTIFQAVTAGTKMVHLSK